ncbi:hypothetical protein CYLTODRAFT_355661 [Cylindrobasidium torrendii FP15055 ss-10]|uniref:AAA+ ATPase domain-containing protein n=1 Tax=Cylindrobasidium torrendii FP15055 ss-10 TaxID=1314674 RepID=A0A0D7B6A0_9AGAR|nr:hypothetical protein CYLTODRAFT_355661 [Cylindrobasidium torrendii FP15055 ss-10]
MQAALHLKTAIQVNEIHGAIVPGTRGANLSVLACATPSAHFTGRSGILDDLSSTSTTPGRQVVTIIGKGGSGKTQLALKLAEIHNGRFAHVLFVDASSTDSLRANFKKLADANGIANEVSDVLAFLAQLRAELLLILDNADDPKVDLGPFIPRSGNVKVVITSRNVEVVIHTSKSQYSLELPDLGLGEAVDLLLSRTGAGRTDINLADAQTLANTMGCLALAVTAAGAYIASSHCTIQKYIALLQKRRQDMLSRRGGQTLDGYYQGTVFSTFELSYSRLSPLAQQFLQICSFYHFADIPSIIFERAAVRFDKVDFPLVLRGEILPVPTMVEDTLVFLKNFLTEGSWEPLWFQDIIREILSVSLMSCSGPFLSFHPLIHQCVQDVVQDKPRVHATALQILAISGPLSDNLESYHLAQQLLPHVNHSYDPDMCSATLSCEFAYVWSLTGYHSKAAASKERQFVLCLNLLGPNDAHTLWVQNFLAELYKLNGEFDKAQDVLAQTLLHKIIPQFPEALGKRSRLFLGLKDTLGAVYLAGGKYAEAEGVLRDVVQQQMETYGELDNCTLDAMHGLALVRWELGNQETAVQMMDAVCRGRRQVLGQGHPDTRKSQDKLHDWRLTSNNRNEQSTPCKG